MRAACRWPGGGGGVAEGGGGGDWEALIGIHGHWATLAKQWADFTKAGLISGASGNLLTRAISQGDPLAWEALQEAYTWETGVRLRKCKTHLWTAEDESGFEALTTRVIVLRQLWNAAQRSEPSPVREDRRP